MSTTPQDDKPISRKQYATAYLVDAISLLVVFIISTGIAIALIMLSDEYYSDHNSGGASMSGLLLIFMPLIWAVLALLYQVVLPMFWRGQTLGSKVAKIRVLDGSRWSGGVAGPLILAAIMVVATTAACLIWLASNLP
jgi:uncharacterized RDD family membrane protein YckC